MKELKIGQKVYVRKIDLYGGQSNSAEIEEFTIGKIGHKYFYLSEDRKQYPIDKITLRHIGNYANFQIYLDKQDVLNEIEVSNLTQSIKRFFLNDQHKKLSLDQLRAIDSIINPKTL